MSCETIREELTAYARGEIEGERQEGIDRHLAECAECREELEKVKEVLGSLAASDEGAVVAQCKRIIQDGIQARASDIHILPVKDGHAVRFRVDGVLHEVERLTHPLGRAVVARLKAMGEMDVAETRLPQDGRIHIRHGDRDIDVREASMPTVWGEKMTLRLLDKSTVLLDIERLGMNEGQLGQVREFLQQPSGMFIVTGPTGAGKTTLLYSMLNELARETLNICTIEDPVEYLLPGIAQAHVNQKAGLSFHMAVRHMLRSDPDVIMCGEVRDLQTVEVLLQATLTGHLTLTTLHTQSASLVFRRLMDMGVEPFLIGDSVSLICAMRLVRTSCEECKEACEPTEAEKAWLDGPSTGMSRADREALKVYRGRGCEVCRKTGYRGRTGVFELLRMSDRLRDLLAAKAGMDVIQDALRGARHQTLTDHGLQKVREGVTTVEEVAGVARSV